LVARKPTSGVQTITSDGIICRLGELFDIIPTNAALFPFISILEDTGYLSRISFHDGGLIEEVWAKIGRSIISLL